MTVRPVFRAKNSYEIQRVRSDATSHHGVSKPESVRCRCSGSHRRRLPNLWWPRPSRILALSEPAWLMARTVPPLRIVPPRDPRHPLPCLRLAQPSYMTCPSSPRCGDRHISRSDLGYGPIIGCPSTCAPGVLCVLFLCAQPPHAEAACHVCPQRLETTQSRCRPMMSP